jgi:hypothetical protein
MHADGRLVQARHGTDFSRRATVKVTQHEHHPLAFRQVRNRPHQLLPPLFRQQQIFRARPPRRQVVGRVSLDPNALDLTLDREVTKRLPVLVDLVGEPAAGATVGEPVIAPLEVAVRGPQSRIGAVSVLKTRPINLNGHAQTFEEMASVLPPDPLASVDPGLVRVRIPMQPPQLSNEALSGPPEER